MFEKKSDKLIVIVHGNTDNVRLTDSNILATLIPYSFLIITTGFMEMFEGYGLKHWICNGNVHCLLISSFMPDTTHGGLLYYKVS